MAIDNKYFICDNCGLSYFLTKESLEEHMRKVHFIYHPSMDEAMKEVKKTVEEDRKSIHGDYNITSRISQGLKRVINYSYGEIHVLSDIQLESLDMICTKIARILSGNANETDHWHDIAGYAILVENELKREKEKK